MPFVMAATTLLILVILQAVRTLATLVTRPIHGLASERPLPVAFKFAPGRFATRLLTHANDIGLSVTVTSRYFNISSTCSGGRPIRAFP
ncbi:hypothetical protein DBB30_19000 [Yersinia pestis]|nr:hypothetical protein C6P85_20960 [Yersinia pestis]PRH51273.1 hypothetical protein C6P90_20815 [Yersinia pestis]PRH52759.1 hypothetical protein C6P83_20970 [Yersinia pestis]PRH63058.1 hypothetical protein C6P89_21175 [Yersinia pestis]PRH64142.1 hypothetical protein C6P80_20310 [Yersinia pestis]